MVFASNVPSALTYVQGSVAMRPPSAKHNAQTTSSHIASAPSAAEAIAAAEAIGTAETQLTSGGVSGRVQSQSWTFEPGWHRHRWRLAGTCVFCSGHELLFRWVRILLIGPCALCAGQHHHAIDSGRAGAKREPTILQSWRSKPAAPKGKTPRTM